MGARQRKWARKRRAEIIEILGGCCRVCRTDEKLELDCIISTGHCNRCREQSALVSFYNKMLKENNLQILCESCHSKKTRKENPPWFVSARNMDIENNIENNIDPY